MPKSIHNIILNSSTSLGPGVMCHCVPVDCGSDVPSAVSLWQP